MSIIKKLTHGATTIDIAEVHQQGMGLGKFWETCQVNLEYLLALQPHGGAP